MLIGGYNYRQRFNKKPTATECADIIRATINAETDAKILSGFYWRGMPVWLSMENQFNYKAAYDIAVQTSGKNLPVRFKFGTDKEPVFYDFETMEEFSEFYASSLEYIQNLLNACWEEKQSLNLSLYE